jgi:hypothetical protein
MLPTQTLHNLGDRVATNHVLTRQTRLTSPVRVLLADETNFLRCQFGGTVVFTGVVADTRAPFLTSVDQICSLRTKK